MTVKEAFDNFIFSRKLADLSPKTISGYLQFVTPFVQTVGSNKELSMLKQEDINNYISKLMTRAISKATRATYIRHLKIYLRWSENEYGAEYCAKNIRIPKSPKRSVRIYSDEEIVTIFDSIHANKEWLVMRNKCIIALMYDSGLRQSEVCNIKHNKVFFSERRITVQGKGDKERTVPLGELTRQYMKEYMNECPYALDYMFLSQYGERMTGNTVKLMVTKLANHLPFELSSHKLRHNFATNYCLDQYEKYGQIDIYRLMYLLGHEEIETTKRYLHFAYEIIASKNCISHLDSIYIRKR